jgi:hypothetical protein
MVVRKCHMLPHGIMPFPTGPVMQSVV